MEAQRELRVGSLVEVPQQEREGATAGASSQFCPEHKALGHMQCTSCRSSPNVHF